MGGSASKALGKELRDAARAGDTAQMQTLLASKAPVDHNDKHGYTALMYASLRGHSAPVEVLLAAKANVGQAANDHNGGRTALILASMRGHSAPVEVLLAAKANVDQADKYYETPLDYASMGGHGALAELLKSWPRLTPLMLAVVLQRPQEINALLHAGADPTCTVQLPSGTPNVTVREGTRTESDWMRKVTLLNVIM